tara:strand:- start:173 stop:526 length:354 start_codon:yes stop_codon:yes gene_type:complete
MHLHGTLAEQPYAYAWSSAPFLRCTYIYPGKEDVGIKVCNGGIHIHAYACTYIYPGKEDAGIKVGSKEQAACTLAEIALDDPDMQEAIIDAKGVPPLLTLIRLGSVLGQEHAARTEP